MLLLVQKLKKRVNVKVEASLWAKAQFNMTVNRAQLLQ